MILKRESMNKKRRRKKTVREFSKIWVCIILTVLLIDFQILIFMNQETLAVAVVTEIFGVFGGYMIKAYLGKRNEEENKLIEKEWENDDE